MKTVGGFLEKVSCACVEPISAISSSFTILITCCPGFSPCSTSVPTALSVTFLINSLTILKLTSASRRAIFTSRMAAFTSASVSTPLLLSCLNTSCSLLERFSNAINRDLLSGQDIVSDFFHFCDCLHHRCVRIFLFQSLHDVLHFLHGFFLCLKTGNQL